MDRDAARDAARAHTPVLLDESLDLLAPALAAPGAIAIDATLGMGGHAEGALRRFPELTLVGIDRDAEAIRLASARLGPYAPRFHAVHATYARVGEVADRFGRRGLVDAVLFDLGVSSLQLDRTERGFSYAHDAPLDMRMDATSGTSAADLLATAGEEEIARILREYGEERFAARISRAIVRARGREPIARTGQLAELVRAAIPAPARRRGGNPAKRTFQALRIAVNDELGLLARALPTALAHLRIGGRMVVESYQSLEDRIVKRTFRRGTSPVAPPDLPVVPPQAAPTLAPLTRGALRAGADEVARNPRSASVRLRAVEVIAPWRADS